MTDWTDERLAGLAKAHNAALEAAAQTVERRATKARVYVHARLTAHEIRALKVPETSHDA